jgi:hypothetical protein
MGRIRYCLKHGENTGIAVGNFGGCRGLSFDLSHNPGSGTEPGEEVPTRQCVLLASGHAPIDPVRTSRLNSLIAHADE